MPARQMAWQRQQGLSGILDRPAMGLGEIEGVAHRVARTSGLYVAGTIHQSYDTNGPLASIQAVSGGERISVNPRAAREVPLNAWAFIFGHEFAHQVYNFGHRGHTDPQQELRADIIGARYAMDAGYELRPYIRWMLSRPSHYTPSHGDLHWRAHELAKHYGVGR
ncbi:hypothetical protein llg_02240 [Luteolibacter sp. LG18]|nr:hypothetical protein llg_02240 [Luteolibacter sp. LG18]